MTYPLDFPVPIDTGGPGSGQAIGGFGGNPAVDQAAHRDVLATLGRAPVMLVHGNGGAADVRPWDLLDQRRFLRAAGYHDELIWAPSYLGGGAVDLQTPHTNNVADVRSYLDAVCEYLGVELVDMITHSLGCTLMYAVFRGLDRQTRPITFNQPKKWNRVGTFVALAGAFHGLGAGSIGEWRTGGEFMSELLAETGGGGGETPFADGKPQTPPPVPHSITYFCGTAVGDFVDAQNPGTGRLDGAVNRSYNLGAGTQGHQAIKESQVVFSDFLPLLNSVPPAPAVSISLDRASGQHPAPLIVTVGVAPPEMRADVQASRVKKRFVNGFIEESVAEARSENLGNGQALTLEAPGFWHLAASAAGNVDPVARTYWVGVDQLEAVIDNDNSVPFGDSLLVIASASDPAAALYYSLDRTRWSEGAAVTIAQDSIVSFIAITADGTSSEVISRSFSKRIAWDDAVTASAVEHFLAGRIGVTEYVAYSDQFGFFAPFTLYLVNGDWVLDPQRPVPAVPVLVRESALARVEDAGETVLAIRVVVGDPQPGEYPVGSLGVTVEAVGGAGRTVVHYTSDGSIPTVDSPSFMGSTRFELPRAGNQAIACLAVDSIGHRIYRVFYYARPAE